MFLFASVSVQKIPGHNSVFEMRQSPRTMVSGPNIPRQFIVHGPTLTRGPCSPLALLKKFSKCGHGYAPDCYANFQFIKKYVFQAIIDSMRKENVRELLVQVAEVHPSLLEPV